MDSVTIGAISSRSSRAEKRTMFSSKPASAPRGPQSTPAPAEELGWVLTLQTSLDAAHAEPQSLTFQVSGSLLFSASYGDDRGSTARTPRAVVIQVRERREEALAAVQFLSDLGLAGTVPTLLAAPMHLVRTLEDAPVDDFVTVPCSDEEIAERIRRIAHARPERVPSTKIRVGSLEIDTASHRVAVDGRPAILTRREYALLVFLVQNPDRVFTREELVKRVWANSTQQGHRTVDIHVLRLRTKLGPSVAPLETVRGFGYRFARSAAADAAMLYGASAATCDAHGHGTAHQNDFA